jgi:Fe2+ or Zn2+ uptake regulation protein
MLVHHGLRCTAQRIALYDALRSTTAHPTAEDLFRTVESTAERMSLATVYNTLEAFCDAGLARKLPTVDGRARYDADTSPHLHVRFRDSSCIRDVPADLGHALMNAISPEVLRTIEARMGITIDGLNVQLIARGHDDCDCNTPRDGNTRLA